MNKHQKILIGLTAGFLAITVLPNIIFPFVKKYDTYSIEKTENRAVNEFPKQFTDDIGTKIDLCINDHAPFRSWLLEFHNLIDKKLNNLTDFEFYERACVGKDNWLFYTGEGELNYYSHVNIPNEEELQELLNKFNEIDRRLKAIGKKFEIVVCPNKTTMYPEYMPTNITVQGELNRLEMISKYLEDHGCTAKFLYLKDFMTDLKKTGQKIYYKQDTHWTPNNAYYSCKEILKNVDKEVQETEVFETEELKGDLSPMANREQTVEASYGFSYRPEIQATWSTGGFTSTTPGNEGTVGFEKCVSTNTNGGNLFLIRDSFAEFFKDIIGKEYSTVTYAHTHGGFNSSVVESPEFKNADTIIFESVERAETILYGKGITPKGGLLDELLYGLDYYKN